MLKKLFPIAVVFCFLFCCQSLSAQTVIKYKESNENIKNPERGLYLYGEDSLDHSNGCWWNSPAKFQEFKKKLEDADKTNQMSLVYLQYDLGEFRQTDKELKKLEGYFKCVQIDFDVLKMNGFKAVLRFSFNPRKKLKTDGKFEVYDDYGNKDIKPNLCGLDGANKCEESVERIVNKYLTNKIFTDFIKNNAHLIAVWQAGFLGKYGEWYYTNDDAGVKEASNMKQRLKILDGMLQLLPKPGFIQVRTPFYKEYAYRISTNENYLKRVGIYDDAFFDSDIYSTFGNYGDPIPNIEELKSEKTMCDWKDKLIEDTKVPVGGEIVDDFVMVPFPTWEEGKEKIFDEFKKYHYSFFNEAKVLDPSYADKEKKNPIIDWTLLRSDTQKRLEKGLGYRIALKEAKYNEKVKIGNKLTVNLTLWNRGFTAPYSSRKIEIFLCKSAEKECPDSSKGYTLVTNPDITDWLPTEINESKNAAGETIETAINPIIVRADVPTTGLTPGNYEIYLNLPDSSSALSNEPAYSIRLANLNEGNFLWTGKNYNHFGSINIQ